MSVEVTIHGPLCATSVSMTGASYGTIGVVKIIDEDGAKITLFAPTPEAGALIAHAINAAWPEVAKAVAA